MAIIEKTVFETSDKKQFDTLEDAQQHESFEAIKAEMCRIIRGTGLGEPNYDTLLKIVYRMMRNAESLTALLNQPAVAKWMKQYEN